MNLTLSDKFVIECSKRIIQSQINLLRNNSKLLDSLLEIFLNHNVTWAIVGGAPRDWLTNNEVGINDIDIAINSDNKLNQIINSLIEKNNHLKYDRTKLGGYRIYSNGLEVDVWEAKETIGIKKGKFKNTNLFRSVSKSAALSIDSIVYTSKGSIYERSFFNTLYTGVLQLNHTRIDRGKSIANKAINLCNKYSLIPDIALQSFIMKELNMEKKELYKLVHANKNGFKTKPRELVINSKLFHQAE